MEEQLISFETAKLAKDKGFYNQIKSDGTDKIYFPKLIPYGKCYNIETKELITPKTYNPNNRHALAPTQSLLQKWLREKHNIWIFISGNKNEYDFGEFTELEVCIFINNTKDKGNYIKVLECKSYEEALEIGLQEGLKLIK